MQCKWSKSAFLLKNRIYDQQSFDNIDIDNDEEDIEIRIEKEDEELDKLIYIKEKYNNLNLPGRILYDMVYNEGLNTREISERIKLNMTSTWYMVKRLKKYMKGELTENDRIV
jgi:DNA-directed RNA polymerase specialized sigma subunit